MAGFLIAAAIDKYVYINVHRRFVDGFLLKYSQLEEAATIDEIKHPIIREALKLVGVQAAQSRNHQHGRYPCRHWAGLFRQFHHRAAEGAARLEEEPRASRRSWRSRPAAIELEKLGEPIGKQDQYIAAFGGITCFQFLPDGRVEAAPLKISEETLFNLEDNLLLFFTGYSRSASEDPEGAGRQEQAGRQGDDREPAFHEGAGENAAKRLWRRASSKSSRG